MVRSLLVLLALSSGIAVALAREDAAPAPLEHAIAEVPGALAITDPLAVFAYVLRNVPDEARVYPTENYYYFRFVRAGVRYAGNIRLAAADRDQGKVHFAYGIQPTDRRPQPSVKYTVFDASRGVAVTKLSSLSYRVSHEGRTVAFVLNDLSKAAPRAGLLQPDEALIGPVFDESAVRFFLVFNARLKVFHYLLDETEPAADEWVTVPAVPGVQIGKRTGFAIYEDGGRKTLVGVSRRNSRLNNSFDGPFDQLPENFIVGETLRDAIVAADQSAKGRIDRLGHFLDGSGRYLIHPYLLYRTAADLKVFHRCVASKRVPPERRPLCVVIDDDEAQKRNPRPRAMLRR